MNTVFKMASSFPGSLMAEQDADFARSTTHTSLPIFPFSFPELRSFDPFGQHRDSDQNDRSSGKENAIFSEKSQVLE